MNFWNELKSRLHKYANLDEHAANIAQHGTGSQIMVPKALNDGSKVSDDYHSKVKNEIEVAGLKHDASPAVGGWMSDEHGLMIEPMMAHRGYGAEPVVHQNVRESVLPKMKDDLSQESVLGTYRGKENTNDESKLLPPFTMHTLHARMPIDLDPSDANNEDYRGMLGQIANAHGGFTHYQTPKGNQLEVLGHSPEDLKKTQESISEYLKQNHGVEGNFDMPSVKGYIYPPPAHLMESQPKTASLRHKTADVRNALHELIKGTQRGDTNCLQYFQGLDKSPMEGV